MDPENKTISLNKSPDTRNFKRNLSVLSIFLIIVIILAVIYVFITRKDTDISSPVVWKINTDGTVTFTNRIGKWKKSQYAWYVMSGAEPILKTKYSTNNTFTYTLDGNCDLSIKAFVRIGPETDFEQSTYTVNTKDIYENCNTESLKKTGELIIIENYSGDPITWEKNEDGSYKFINHVGTEQGAKYAWYVLRGTEPVLKQNQYSSGNTFIYDLEDNPELVITGFVRIGTEEEYKQTSYKVYASDILNSTELNVIDEQISEDNLEQIKYNLTESGVTTLPYEKVLAADASDWGIDLHIPVDWTCENISNRSYGLYLNGFSFLDDTYRNYIDSANEDDAKLILQYLLDWAEQNPEYDPEKEWQWHDDATANRLYRMAIFTYEFSDYLSSDQKDLLNKSLASQADLLSKDFFYTKNHNHGMHQDKALLVYAFLHTTGETKINYIKTALSRTLNYLNYVYTKDGVHKEHSPFYARDILIDLRFFRTLVSNCCPDFISKTDSIFTGGINYLLHIVMPDRHWPSLGDSTLGGDGLKHVRKISPENKNMLWAITGGAEGEKPEDWAVFPEGGYAIFRSSWYDAPEKATWMLFNAATHSSTHKHGDDLEVLLYHKGDLFIEAGKRNFNYQDEMTAWAYSGYGHNVLIVNGEAYPVRIGENGYQSIYPEALDTKIIDYDITEDVMAVSGFEHRFQNVEQTRTLTYNRQTKEVSIEDILNAAEDFEGTLLWHVAEGVAVIQYENYLEFYRGDEFIASMNISSDLDFSIETIIGEEGDYPWKTWIFEGQNTPRYGTLLKINFTAMEGLNSIQCDISLK